MYVIGHLYYLELTEKLLLHADARTRLFNQLPRVFHDPLVSLIFEGFDPQIFLNNPKNYLFTFFNSDEGGHCDPFNRKLRENPGYQITIF